MQYSGMADTGEFPTVPESHRDLTDHKIGVLSTVGSSGRPQSTAIWFMLGDDNKLRISLTDERQKTKNMAARPMATLFVIDPLNPMRTLEVRADVSIAPDTDLAFMRAALSYYGADFDTFPAPKEGRVIVTLTPRRVVANG